ncbi:PREDICTED: uncharacterized protein LOC105557249 [Vollenhovia emeryi]|uniref:uncharacterized protein LOC105557249 n=1 Tax=Vollenhovia emeryi TaxID=411798 RepID=UPI0005F45DC4|nr:PREDICTED: uncharacterized protein LOC105557249 [Vollenhovia emeryi]
MPLMVFEREKSWSPQDVTEDNREEAMEGIRQVMEGISISAITNEKDAASMRKKLEDVILGCQRAMFRLPDQRKNKDKKEEGKSHPEERKADDRDVSRQTRSDRKKRGKSGNRAEEAKGAPTKPDNKEEMPKPQRVPRQAQTKTLQKKEQPREKQETPLQRRGTYAEAAKKPAKRVQPADGKSAPQKSKGSNEGKNAPMKKEAATQPATDKGRGSDQRKRRTPRSEAVSIMFPAGEFAQGMRDIQSKINLDELGIGPLKQRKALTGALILEVAGDKKMEKANLLAEHIRKAVGNKEGVRVTRPSKMGEIRIKDLNELVTQAELQEVVAKVGECDGAEIKVGQLKSAPGGMVTVWVQCCPLAVAKRMAEKRRDKGGMGVGKGRIARRPPTRVLPLPRAGAREAAVPKSRRSK